MGVRYRNEFTSNEGIDWKIDIHEVGFGGSVTEFVTHAPGFTLAYPSEDSERPDPIKGSSLRVHFESQTSADDSFISDIIGAQEETYSIALYKEGNLYWTGHMLTDNIQEQDAPKPYTIDLEATDSLKRLKDIDYDNSGALYTGFETFVGHVINILGLTNLSQFWGANDKFLSVGVDWWDDNHPAPATAEDPFILTRVQHEVFYLKDELDADIANNAYDVLDQILRLWFCRITQSNGRWLIMQVPQYVPTIFDIRNYKKAGTSHSTGEEDLRKIVTQTSIAKLATGISNWYPAISKMSLIYNHKEASRNLLPSTITDDTLVTAGLVVSGVGNRIQVTGKVRLSYVKTAGDTEAWVAKYAITLELQTTPNKKYIDGRGAVNVWTTVISTYDFASYVFSTPLSTIGFQEYLNISFITSEIPDTAIIKFKIVEVGFVERDLSTPATFTTAPVSTYEEFEMTFLDGGDFKEKDKFEIVNNTGSSPTKSKFITELPESILGDGPTGVAEGHLEASDGAGSPTWVDSTAWDKASGADNLNIHNLQLQEILAGQKIPREKMQARIKGDFDVVDRLSYDSKAWVFNGATLTAMMDEWDGEWFDISRVITNQTFATPTVIVRDIQVMTMLASLANRVVRLENQRQVTTATDMDTDVAGTESDMAYDYNAQKMYVCTGTGDVGSATWQEL